VTAVEPQFVLLPIVPLLKVVQALVIVLYLQTIQFNTIQYKAPVTGSHGHYTKQTYLSKCLDIFCGNEHAWIHILEVPLERLTVQSFPEIVTFSQVPDVPLLIGNTILEY